MGLSSAPPLTLPELAAETAVMVTFGFAGGVQTFDPLVLLLIAMVIEAALGDMRLIFRFVPHPVVVLGRLIGWLDRKLNREHRPPADRAIRGGLVTLFVAALCGVGGWGVAWLTRNHDFGWIVELSLVVALLAQRGLYDHVRRVQRALENEGVEAGRDAVAHIVGRDVRQLDEHGVARAAIESCAENFSDAVVAPAFWYVLFGFPGLAVYKAVNTMDSMIGYRTVRHAAFGMAAARTDDVLNLIPARLSAMFLAVAALFVPTATPAGAARVMWRDAGKHRSPNAGWPESATAGALGLALAGPRRYAESVVADPWIGDGRARATAKDIGRALYLYFVGCLINVMVIAAVAVVRYSLP